MMISLVPCFHREGGIEVGSVDLEGELDPEEDADPDRVPSIGLDIL